MWRFSDAIVTLQQRLAAESSTSAPLGGHPAYWLGFGVVIVIVGACLGSNIYGAAENLAWRWNSNKFTVRVVGMAMIMMGAFFMAAAIYDLLR